MRTNYTAKKIDVNFVGFLFPTIFYIIYLFSCIYYAIINLCIINCIDFYAIFTYRMHQLSIVYYVYLSRSFLKRFGVVPFALLRVD